MKMMKPNIVILLLQDILRCYRRNKKTRLLSRRLSYKSLACYAWPGDHQITVMTAGAPLFAVGYSLLIFYNTPFFRNFKW